MEKALNIIYSNAHITRGVYSLDVEAVRPILSSIIGTCENEFGFTPPLRQVRVERGAGGAIKIQPTSYGEVDVVLYRDCFQSLSQSRSFYKTMVLEGESASGTTFETMGAHEAMHIVETMIAFNRSRTGLEAKQVLETQRIGKTIVNRAVELYNKTAGQELDSAAFVRTFARNVSINVVRSIREAPCEAAQDLDANGSAASALSRALVDAAKEVYNESTRKRP